MADASRAQVKIFDRARRLAAALNKMTNAAVAMGENISDGVRIARANGIDLPQSLEYLSEIGQLQAMDQRIQRIMGAVVIGDLGIRTSTAQPNDIDVMADNDDEAGQYFSGIALIIIGGIVVFGLITTLWSQIDRANRITAAYEQQKSYVDDVLCATPGSPQCTGWEAQKRSVEHLERKSWWEDLMAAAKRLASHVESGTKWGIMIAIPLAVWLLASKLDKRRG